MKDVNTTCSMILGLTSGKDTCLVGGCSAIEHIFTQTHIIVFKILIFFCLSGPKHIPQLLKKMEGVAIASPDDYVLA